MDDGRFEHMLAELLQQDFAARSATFREELLARCLAVVNADMRDETAEARTNCHAVEWDDADLELLAAAGNPDTREQRVDLVVPKRRKPI